jgi:hypothetical protein
MQMDGPDLIEAGAILPRWLVTSGGSGRAIWQCASSRGRCYTPWCVELPSAFVRPSDKYRGGLNVECRGNQDRPRYGCS